MTLPYQRQQGEHLDDYKLRLCKNKELYNLTWQNIADEIEKEYGVKYNESTIRKWFKAWKQGFEQAVTNNVSSQQILDEIEMKRIELEQLKVLVNDQRREYKKLTREQARIDDVRDTIAQAIKEFSKEKLLNWQEPIETTNENEAVLLLSDWHVGMEINSYFNTYNINIFKNRLSKLKYKVKQYCKRHNVNKLHVLCIGDFLHGILHLTGRINSNEDVIRQIQICSEALSEFIVDLANNIEQTELYFARGNHDRVHASKEESIAKESFADLIPWYLKVRLEHCKNVNFNENKYNDEIIYFNVFDTKIMSMHGHRDSVQSAIKNIPQMFGIVPDMICLGHFHHNFEKDNGTTEIVINGSLCGSDQYAIERRLYAKPMQKLMIFDAYEGRECTYNIRL